MTLLKQAVKKSRLVQLHCYSICSIDKPYMAISLRKVSPLRAIVFMDIFTEEHKVVSKRQQLFKDFLRFFQTINARERFHIPERTYQKCRFRFPKVVFMQIAVKQAMLAL